MTNLNFLNFSKKISLVLTLLLVLSRCSEEPLQSDVVAEDQVIQATAVAECSACTYVVPATTHVIDGKILDLKPGNVIGLNASVAYKNLVFRNIVGTASQPIIIKNCGGRANINGTGLRFAIKTENSKHFRITGGSLNQEYGIKVYKGNLGITLDKLSSNFEVDHIEIANSGFAGIMAKTDPSCDAVTTRGNFTMTNISIHDNYVHDTGGEGMYVGNSFYQHGMKLGCGIKLPHEIHYVKIFNNVVKNTGWDGIQLGSATKGAEVYNNTIENFGIMNVKNQRNGIQIGEGTGGLCHGNIIMNGVGNGLIVMGLGDNVVYNNIITNPGGFGVFCDERVSPGPGFKFINNTIINPKSDGIRIYADKVPMNVIINNIIVNPGSYSTYKYPRTGDDAFVYKLSKYVKTEMSNNYFTRNIADVKFINAGAYNYRLTSASPTVNKGKSISTYNIPQDFYKQLRLKGPTYDIGAAEF